MSASKQQNTASQADGENPTAQQAQAQETPRGRRRRKKVVKTSGTRVQSFKGNVRGQVTFWLLTLVIFTIFLFTFSSILLPFVAGIAIAYFLNPIIELMERFGISRMWATVIILLTVIVVFVLALAFVAPILTNQLQGFIASIPEYAERLRAALANMDLEWIQRYIGIDSNIIQNNISTIISQGGSFTKTMIESLWNSGRSLISLLSLLVIAPVIAFYMMLDWDKMVSSIDSWIPRQHLETVRGIFHEMDRAVAGFIRGQGTVCLILGGYYAIGLTLTGLNFGLLIGLFIGLISFIPYIGSMIGFVLAFGIAWLQYWPDQWGWIVAVACVFFTGQFVEGNVLQPKLVGSSVGLHPVWLMFALFAFSSLFGFTGMLLAVPAAAAVGVLVRFGLHTYLASPMYDEDKNLVVKDEKAETETA